MDTNEKFRKVKMLSQTIYNLGIRCI